MNLGHLIDTLKIFKPDSDVYISAPIHLVPGRLESYRGIYADLAIVPIADTKEVKVRAFLLMLEAAIGAVFEGYKGGEFIMNRNSGMWIAEHGESSSCRVTSVANVYGDARIEWMKTE